MRRAIQVATLSRVSDCPAIIAVPFRQTGAAVSMKILKDLGPPSRSYIFPGQRETQPLSNMAMLMLLRRMQHESLTVQGFRSSFRGLGR